MEIKYSVIKRTGDHIEKHKLNINGADASLLERILNMIHTPAEEEAKPVVEKMPEMIVPKAQKEKSVEVKTDAAAKEKKEADLFHLAVSQIADKKDRPRSLPLKSDTRGGFPIENLLNKEKGRNPNIRYIDGEDGEVALYPTRCVCPSCGHDHKRYLRERNIYVKCKNCGEKLEMQNATPNPLEENADGVYFIATRVFQ